MSNANAENFTWSSGRELGRFLPRELEGLATLALDLRFAHDPDNETLWDEINREVWRTTRSPWLVLVSSRADRLEELRQNARFLEQVERQLKAREHYLRRAKWFEQAHPERALRVAYFSMEFGLSPGFPMYAGGLGILAGDHIKSASDLGVPMVGVSLLFQSGYFRQLIGPEGDQIEVYPDYRIEHLPVRPVLSSSGDQLRVGVELPGRVVYLRVWQIQVGSATLYLLDSNDSLNSEEDRKITSRLYGGDLELRIKQEIALGIGGWRMLEALGIDCPVCHLNEGHTAFAVLERARSFMTRAGKSFGVALRCTRAGNLFTTHTAVPEGLDSFPPELFGHYFRDYARELGLSLEELLALGRADPANTQEPFKMAYLALRGSGFSNGVSKLHGEISRRLFHPAFPHWPDAEVPIGHITNGVHVPSWTGAETFSLWREDGALARDGVESPVLVFNLQHMSDEALWQMRNRARPGLVEFRRERLSRTPVFSDGGQGRFIHHSFSFDPAALTLGFARRFVAYKRPDLLLYDQERLIRILSNPERPVQLVIAGKAHPSDFTGKQAVRRWMDFIRRPEVAGRVVFAEDYDMTVGAQLVRGVDLWINNPRRPWEACGTSGMKVVLNGGLNLSTLDGWWDEAYSPEVGWALGDRREFGDDAQRDKAEAETLYWLLEHEVIPTFYNRDARGVPFEWVARIRQSMTRLAPWVSSWRMMREYVERYYLPALGAFERRAADNGALAEELARLSDELAKHWQEISFGQLKIKGGDTAYEVVVEVRLGEVAPQAVNVELYAEATAVGKLPLRVKMECVGKLAEQPATYAFRAAIPSTQPASTYALRVIPYHPELLGPIEAPQILWRL